MAPQEVAIVTDSAAAVPHALQAKYGIRVIPMHISIGQEVFSEGVNISPPRVVGALLAGSKVHTYEPPVAEIARAYQECADAGARYVVSIHVSSKVHKVVQSAEEAAKSSPIPVTVIDSGTIAMAEGWIVLAAAAVAHLGSDADAVAEAARTTAESTRTSFTVDTLEYLHRDGRVPGIIKSLSNTLHMRPILEIQDGDIALVDRIRQTEPARHKVRSTMQDYAKTLTRPAVAVALVGASALEHDLGVETTGFMIEESPGASLTAHAGPGTYIVAAADMPAEFMLEL
jgi:DegV family protein with EDD domain